MIKKLLTAALFGATMMLSTSAFATTSPSPSTPSPTITVCASGPTWEEGRASFEEIVKEKGGKFVAKWVSPEDKSFAVIYDFRGAPDVSQETPFFVLVFDPNGCFLVSTFFSEQQVQDAFGIVLTSN